MACSVWCLEKVHQQKVSQMVGWLLGDWNTMGSKFEAAGKSTNPSTQIKTHQWHYSDILWYWLWLMRILMSWLITISNKNWVGLHHLHPPAPAHSLVEVHGWVWCPFSWPPSSAEARRWFNTHQVVVVVCGGWQGWWLETGCAIFPRSPSGPLKNRCSWKTSLLLGNLNHPKLGLLV